MQQIFLGDSDLWNSIDGKSTSNSVTFLHNIIIRLVMFIMFENYVSTNFAFMNIWKTWNLILLFPNIEKFNFMTALSATHVRRTITGQIIHLI